jgi:hypothetical protein
MTTANPDLFTNVHKGIRKALFDSCAALGRAGGDVDRDAAARTLLRDALSFVELHGDNEDVLLLPLLNERVPSVLAAMTRAHQRIEPILRALTADAATAPIDALYQRTCAFTALYLEHLREEECDLEPSRTAFRLRCTASSYKR